MRVPSGADFTRSRSKHNIGLEWSQARRADLTIGRHFHDDLQLMLVERGARGISLGTQRSHVAERELVLIPPGIVHGSFVWHAGVCDYRSVHVSTALVRELSVEIFGSTGHEFLKIDRLCDVQLGRELIKLHIAVRSSDESLWIETALVRFFQELGKRIRLRERTNPRESAKHPALMRVKEYIDAYHSRPIGADELACTAGLSKFHLLRMFQSTFGISPHAYHIQCRVNYAKQLIAQGCELSSVAANCGFADQSHLGRHFKSSTGVTPGAYRESLCSLVRLHKRMCHARWKSEGRPIRR
ncbi:MAG: AraC family transcriptional regulator [Betaproteobacteria bacterium]|nr:AraC family transcriptional regulator [Betaproteobacteria bacterium]